MSALLKSRILRIAALVAILSVPVSLWPQVGSGSITGVIRDATQSAIPNAAIKVINTQSGVRANAVSNATGAYRVNALLPGSYRIEATVSGFSPVIQEGITLSTGQT